MGYWMPRLIGAITGLAMAGYVVVYLPMRANYLDCGRVTLCRP